MMFAAPVVRPPVETERKAGPLEELAHRGSHCQRHPLPAPFGIGGASDPARFGVELVGIDEFLGNLHLAVFELHTLLVTERPERTGDLLCLLQAFLHDHLEHLSVELLELGILQEFFDIEILEEKELNVSEICQIVRHDNSPFGGEATLSHFSAGSAVVRHQPGGG